MQDGQRTDFALAIGTADIVPARLTDWSRTMVARMIDDATWALAKQRIELEITEHDKRLDLELSRIAADAYSRGLGHSGNHYLRRAEACANAVQERGQIAWTVLHRVVTTVGVSHYDTLTQDLVDCVSGFLPEPLADLKAKVLPASSFGRDVNFLPQLEAVVDDARVRTLKMLANEIQLFAETVKRRATSAAERTSNVMHFYSPVGSVQTGAHSIANVSMTLDAAMRDQLSDALKQILNQLPSVEALSPVSRDEVGEIVEGAIAEVQKEKPNSRKLTSFLSTIAASIQTVASLKDAYEVVKKGLLLLGVAV